MVYFANNIEQRLLRGISGANLNSGSTSQICPQFQYDAEYRYRIIDANAYVVLDDMTKHAYLIGYALVNGQIGGTQWIPFIMATTGTVSKLVPLGNFDSMYLYYIVYHNGAAGTCDMMINLIIEKVKRGL